MTDAVMRAAMWRAVVAALLLAAASAHAQTYTLDLQKPQQVPQARSALSALSAHSAHSALARQSAASRLLHKPPRELAGACAAQRLHQSRRT